MVGADVFLQFTFSSAKFYFQHAGSLLSAYCILSASLNPYPGQRRASDGVALPRSLLPILPTIRALQVTTQIIYLDII